MSVCDFPNRSFGDIEVCSIDIASDLTLSGGDIVIDSDTGKVLLGDGQDASLTYDGTDMEIDTSLVAASDLEVTCGTGKTLELQNAVWDDQQVLIGAIKKGASAPADIAYKGSEVLNFQNGQDNKITFTAQLSHRYKLGTDLEFHVHCTPTDNTAGNVRWVLTYSWADIGSDFPAETTTTTAVAVAANSQDSHLLHEVDTAVSSASAEAGVSGFLLCSLMREATDPGDTYNADLYVVGLDFHYQLDTMGSRLETTK